MLRTTCQGDMHCLCQVDNQEIIAQTALPCAMRQCSSIDIKRTQEVAAKACAEAASSTNASTEYQHNTASSGLAQPSLMVLIPALVSTLHLLYLNRISS